MVTWRHISPLYMVLANLVPRAFHLGCVPLRWCGSGSMIRDHSDHGSWSNEPMNPLWTRIHRFISSTMIQVIADRWSWFRSSLRNAPLENGRGGKRPWHGPGIGWSNILKSLFVWYLPAKCGRVISTCLAKISPGWKMHMWKIWRGVSSHMKLKGYK